MANDKNWEKRSTEWVEMSHKSRQRKEAQGKSRPRTESNLTDLEKAANNETFRQRSHGKSVLPRGQ